MYFKSKSIIPSSLWIVFYKGEAGYTEWDYRLFPTRKEAREWKYAVLGSIVMKPIKFQKH
jgi:hypothetical protein